MFLCTAKTKKHYKAKRLGTRAVKEPELLDSVGDRLSDAQSTA